MAAKAEVGFFHFQVILSRHGRMDGMAVVARDTKRFVLAKIPVFHAPHIFMACETFRLPIIGVRFSAEDKNGYASSSALFNMLSPGAMA
jgi:hypothetical protein